MIMFGPFQNTWVERGQLTWNLCCINMSKYVTATGPKKWGSTHAACSCPPPPQAGCRNSGMQADVRANTGQWGMRLSRREKSGRYWIVKESALRKLSQNMWQQHHVFACPPKGLIFKEYQKYSRVQQSDAVLVGLFEQLTGGGESVCEAVGGSWRDCLRWSKTRKCSNICDLWFILDCL